MRMARGPTGSMTWISKAGQPSKLVYINSCIAWRGTGRSEQQPIGVNGYTWGRGIFPFRLPSLFWLEARAQQPCLSRHVPGWAFKDEKQRSETISAGRAACPESLPVPAAQAPTRSSGDTLSESLHGGFIWCWFFFLGGGVGETVGVLCTLTCLCVYSNNLSLVIYFFPTPLKNARWKYSCFG